MKNAAVSGVCAAIGAVLGKVAFGSETAEALLWTLSQSPPPEVVVWAVRALFLVAMLATNALMLHFYVKGLTSAGTLLGTVTNTGVNVMASSVLARVLFNEQLGAEWLLGALCMVAGIFCIQKAGHTNPEVGEVPKEVSEEAPKVHNHEHTHEHDKKEQ